jgi:hypothetical protein
MGIIDTYKIYAYSHEQLEQAKKDHQVVFSVYDHFHNRFEITCMGIKAI